MVTHLHWETSKIPLQGMEEIFPFVKVECVSKFDRIQAQVLICRPVEK